MPGDDAFQTGLGYTCRWKDECGLCCGYLCCRWRTLYFFHLLSKNWGWRVRRAQGPGSYWVFFVVMCKLLCTAAFHERNTNK